MAIQGAGGTKGGVGRFILGFCMMCGGFYLLLNSIRVTNRFALGSGLFQLNFFGGSTIAITGGMVLIPFIIGIGIIFYNRRNIIGWLLAAGSIVALIFGVISNINFTMHSMSAFELLAILVLAVGGIGLLLSSLRESR
jgi:hypothetical protein